MNKKKITLKMLLTTMLVISIFTISIISMNSKEQLQNTNAQSLSNKKIGWGIKEMTITNNQM